MNVSWHDCKLESGAESSRKCASKLSLGAAGLAGVFLFAITLLSGPFAPAQEPAGAEHAPPADPRRRNAG